MGRTGTTALLAILVAASSAGWAIYTSVQATEVPFPWVPAMADLLGNVAAVVAAILVLRAVSWWRRAALGYLAAFLSLEALGLVQILPFASQYQAGVLSWSLATSVLALVAALLAAAALRDTGQEGEDGVPGVSRWAAVLGGLLIVGSSAFAWVVSPQAPAGRLTPSLSHASTGVWVGTIMGMVVVAGIAAVVATSSERPLVVGATAGLLASRPVAVTIFADPTWRTTDMALAAGWWLALVAQVLLVVALVGMLTAGAGRGAHMTRSPAPTRT